MIASVNREAIAQAAMAFIHVNNLWMQALKSGRPQEYIDALNDVLIHMQNEFLRWISNCTQVHSARNIDIDDALAFAQVIYTSVTQLGIEVL